MRQEKISTTIVRIAVARLESTFRMPDFAKMAVIPANNAEPNANTIHIQTSWLQVAETTIIRNFTISSLPAWFHGLWSVHTELVNIPSRVPLGALTESISRNLVPTKIDKYR